ncbi:hypothetical protein [Pseudomonas aeruginosa]|uniref:hypothetical protein n=1 Tax=Pseudomonas aeruginosa TaxID=287 RepID=UPI0021E92E18|nr:hypothetical protein [Pseudomonas aeruginosa]MCV3870639.1 hypothetical protein [Pseudomonas aeruginosa]
MREEFEAWHHAEFGYVIAVEDDPQQDGQCAERWKAWKASRAALRVELPKSDYADQLDGDAYVMESRAVAKALQQAGIEVEHG